MKAYTDLNQSRKLAEILPIESADMTWVEGEWDEPIIGKITQSPDEDYTFIPCWSLAALLGVLPETIDDEWGEYDLNIDMIDKKPKYVRLCDCYHSDFPSWDLDNEELLDNIVEAVVWLNGNDCLQK